MLGLAAHTRPEFELISYTVQQDVFITTPAGNRSVVVVSVTTYSGAHTHPL
jgi:hypothetical protein